MWVKDGGMEGGGRIPASRGGERAQRVALEVVDRLRGASTPGLAVEALRDACEACFPGGDTGGACADFLRYAYHDLAVFLVTWAGPEWRESFAERDRREVFDRFFGEDVPAVRVAAALLAALHFVASRPRPRRDAVASVVAHLGAFVADRRDGLREALFFYASGGGTAVDGGGSGRGGGLDILDVAPDQVVAWALDVPDALSAAVARSRVRPWDAGAVVVPRALRGRQFRKTVARIALAGAVEGRAYAAAGLVGRLCARGHASVVAGELAAIWGEVGRPGGESIAWPVQNVRALLERVSPHALEGIMEALVRCLVRRAASDAQALACLWSAAGELLLHHDGANSGSGPDGAFSSLAASAGATVHHLFSHRLLLSRVMPLRSVRWVLLLGILRCKGRAPQDVSVFIEGTVDMPKATFIEVDGGVLAAVEPLFNVWRSPAFASGQEPTTPAQQRYVSVALRHVITALGRPSLDAHPKLLELIIRGVNEWIDNPIVRTRRIGFTMGRAFSVALDPAKPVEFPVDDLDGSEGGAFIRDFFDKDWETDPDAWDRSGSSSSSDEESGDGCNEKEDDREPRLQGTRRDSPSLPATKREGDVIADVPVARKDLASPVLRAAPAAKRGAIDPDEVISPFGDEDSDDEGGSSSDGGHPSFPTHRGFNVASRTDDDDSEREPDSDDDSIESLSMSSDEDDLDPVNLLLPKRLQDVIHGLVKGGDPNKPDREGPVPRDLTEACLKGAERLVRNPRNAGQVKALGLPMLEVLIPLTDMYHLGETKFTYRRAATLTALAVIAPEHVVPALTGYFYAPNLMLSTRGEVVEVLVAAASELSELPDNSKQGRTAKAEGGGLGGARGEYLGSSIRSEDGENGEGEDEPYDIYTDPTKTRRWGQRRTADAVPSKNRFHVLAPMFALPLMLHYDRAKQAMEAAAGGKTGGVVDLQRADFYLLAKVAHAVGHFLACNSQWSPTQGAILTPVVNFLKAVRTHAQVFVRRAAILATYQALAHSHSSYWADHYDDLVDVGEWMLEAAGKDADPECRNAAVSTFKLARQHLAQLAPADALELIERQNPHRAAPIIEEFS